MLDAFDTDPDPSTIFQVIKAEVTLGYAPVLDANVTAVVESDMQKVEIILKDNAIGADTMLNDGVYAGYFTQYTGDGKYRVKVKVSSVLGATKAIVGGLAGAYDPAFVIGSEWVIIYMIVYDSLYQVQHPKFAWRL